MRPIDADELIKGIEYEVNRLNSAMYYALKHDMFATRANLKIQKNTLEWLRDEIEKQPSAQPGRLTDDDFETIRIHLNAFKEDLCNQGRWKEAEDYERLIARFMSFASAQAERKKGKWVPGVTLNETGVKPIRKEDATRHGKFWSWDYYCSNCLHSAYHDTDYGEQLFDYCPYCGTKMEGKDE